MFLKKVRIVCVGSFDVVCFLFGGLAGVFGRNVCSRNHSTFHSDHDDFCTEQKLLSNNDILDIVKWHHSYREQMLSLGVNERILSLPGLAESTEGNLHSEHNQNEEWTSISAKSDSERAATASDLEDEMFQDGVRISLIAFKF